MTVGLFMPTCPKARYKCHHNRLRLPRGVSPNSEHTTWSRYVRQATDIRHYGVKTFPQKQTSVLHVAQRK